MSNNLSFPATATGIYCYACFGPFDLESWPLRHMPHRWDCTDHDGCSCDYDTHPECCWQCATPETTHCDTCGEPAQRIAIFELWPFVYACRQHVDAQIDYEFSNGEQLVAIVDIDINAPGCHTRA